MRATCRRASSASRSPTGGGTAPAAGVYLLRLSAGVRSQTLRLVVE
ncbi:hypothetical protein [Hymenobacter saemangeumensis]